jgi:CubicO group peptidase (beta-lactamase class C family)
MRIRKTLPAVVFVALVPLAGGLMAGRRDQPAPSGHARAVECGLVAPDFKAPLRIFSAEYYQAQKPACLADRMAFYKVPGVTMAVIDGNAVAWSKAYGVLEAGTNRSVTAESVFEAASATKMLTTVIALRLAERGVLDLDRDVNAYLESWKVPAGRLTAASPVTLRLLLTHRAGINRPDKGLPYDEQRPPTLAQVLAGAPPAINQGVVVERAPGSSHQYSNIGFLVVQLVLEEATGKKYGQLASELVFKPLGLDSSTVSHPLAPAWRSRWGVPHDEKGVARARSQMPDAVAQGGLVTMPSDLARLAVEIGLASEGRSTRLLSKRSAQMMLTRAADFDPGFGVPVGQGLGVMLLGEGRTLHFLHPGGNDPGANCWIIASPATGQGAAIMTNAAAGEALMLEILASIGHHYRWPDLAAGN